jgi:hypothetical protein
VVDGETGAGGGREQKDEQQLVPGVERHAWTIARRRPRRLECPKADAGGC